MRSARTTNRCANQPYTRTARRRALCYEEVVTQQSQMRAVLLASGVESVGESVGQNPQLSYVYYTLLPRTRAP
jgi:hypothetical protein